MTLDDFRFAFGEAGRKLHFGKMIGTFTKRGSSALRAIFNDHSGEFEFPKSKRTPLVAAISAAGGKTWPRRKIIESDPAGWDCDPTIHFTEDAVLLAYCAGGPKIGHLSRTRVRRINLAWIKTI